MKSFKESKSYILKIFREALVGYTFNLCALIAGVIIAYKLKVFSISSWSVAVYPAILSARGIIGGLFSGRLSTSLHLGTIFPRVFDNTKNFRMLFNAIITLTFVVGVIMSLFSMFFGNLFWRVPLTDFPKILAVILATMTLGLLIGLITIGFSFVSFRQGLNPDIFLYPAVSAFSDILITSFYIGILSLFFSPNPLGLWLIVVLGSVLSISAVYNFVKNCGEIVFMKTLKESFATLIIVAVIVNFTGAALNGINARVEMTGESQILVVYPALIAIIGSVGAIVGSTATTKLAVGLLETSLSGIKNHIGEILGAWTASLTIFTILSLLSLILTGKFSLPLFVKFTFTLFLTNVVAVAVIIIVSFATSILTFQRGLDPDNFVIPIESVLADGVTSVSLLAVLNILV
ncbi:MAG: magnesium transporter [Candidatus Bathyarchaeota archaeon]|jgi:mgtE-like transporter